MRNGRLGSWLSLHSFPTKAINAPSTVPYRNPPITNVLRRLCRAAHKSCNLARPTTHVTAVHELTSNPSLQNARFLLQTCLLCKPAPPSRHSLALRAHRHRLSAVARKKCTLSRAGRCRVEREVSKTNDTPAPTSARRPRSLRRPGESDTTTAPPSHTASCGLGRQRHSSSASRARG